MGDSPGVRGNLGFPAMMDSATLLKIHSAVRWGKPIAELKEAGLTGPDFQQKISADMFAEDRACGFEMNCERLKMLKDLSQNIILCVMAPKIWIAFNLHSMMLVCHLYTLYIFLFLLRVVRRSI